MPFPFTLPTTSSVLLPDFFTSATHPSLPLQATSKRSVLKDALKKHKRLAAQSRGSHLSTIQDALDEYIPYLLALNTASSYRDVGNERIDVEIIKPLEVEWRTTISSSLPGREATRARLTGLHHEVAFTFATLAYVQSLLARSQLSMLHNGPPLTTEQRASYHVSAMKNLLQAHSIHNYLLSLASVTAARDGPIDIQPSTVSGLASLALAEATLLFVAKDDPYSAAVADDRDENNTDWMFKSPTIPKVRASLFARICLQAAEHASQACGLFSGNVAGKVDDDLVRYATNLRRTARGKAARFLAIDAELSSKTGEGLAWLKGAKKELGLSIESDEGRRKGFRGLKQSWQEKREDRKIEKGGEWGMDAGRFEEARIVESLEAKWDRENNAVNMQTVPPIEPLLANMPTGRQPHSPQTYEPPKLDAFTLQQLRAPPDPADRAFRGDEDDSGGEDGYYNTRPPGAFPGASDVPERTATSSSYY